MGCFSSKDKLLKEDLEFLKSHTRYDEATIKEWYKGFKVSPALPFHPILRFFPATFPSVSPTAYHHLKYRILN